MKQSLFQVCLNVEKNQGNNKFAQIGGLTVQLKK